MYQKLGAGFICFIAFVYSLAFGQVTNSQEMYKQGMEFYWSGFKFYSIERTDQMKENFSTALAIFNGLAEQNKQALLMGYLISSVYLGTAYDKIEMLHDYVREEYPGFPTLDSLECNANDKITISREMAKIADSLQATANSEFEDAANAYQKEYFQEALTKLDVVASTWNIGSKVAILRKEVQDKWHQAESKKLIGQAKEKAAEEAYLEAIKLLDIALALWPFEEIPLLHKKYMDIFIKKSTAIAEEKIKNQNYDEATNLIDQALSVQQIPELAQYKQKIVREQKRNLAFFGNHFYLAGQYGLLASGSKLDSILFHQYALELGWLLRTNGFVWGPFLGLSFGRSPRPNFKYEGFGVSVTGDSGCIFLDLGLKFGNRPSRYFLYDFFLGYMYFNYSVRNARDQYGRGYNVKVSNKANEKTAGRGEIGINIEYRPLSRFSIFVQSKWILIAKGQSLRKFSLYIENEGTVNDAWRPWPILFLNGGIKFYF